jgi:AcrR family transcriptional regulator
MPAVPPSPPSLTKGERTRQQIIDAAMKLFLVQGVHRVAFPDIGKAVGIANPTVYKHFPSKEDLLLGCAEVAIERARVFVDAGIDPHAKAADRLRAYLRTNFEWVHELEPELHVLLAMYYYGLTDDRMRKLHERIDEDSVSRVETLLVQGNPEKFWRVRQTRAVARAIHSQLVGEMIKARRAPREMSVEERVRACWDAVKRMTD